MHTKKLIIRRLQKNEVNEWRQAVVQCFQNEEFPLYSLFRETHRRPAGNMLWVMLHYFPVFGVFTGKALAGFVWIREQRHYRQNLICFIFRHFADFNFLALLRFYRILKILLYTHLKNNECYILLAGVLPHLRGSGIAAELFRYVFGYTAERETRKIFLHLKAGNTRAFRFYRKLGFVKTAEQTGTRSFPKHSIRYCRMEKIVHPNKQ
jgi:GNAT superfamily N-acetyltransferase